MQQAGAQVATARHRPDPTHDRPRRISAVGPPGYNAPPAPTVDLPRGLRQLADLGLAAATDRGSLPERLRIVLRVPTLAGASAAVTLGALSASVDCTDCRHHGWRAGSRVSTALDGKLQDGTLELPGRNPSLPTVNGIGLRDRSDTIHLLPSGFPTRRPARLDPAVREDLVIRNGLVPGTEIQFRSRESAHPVVVVENPGRIGVDATWFPDGAVARSPRLHPLGGLDSWFRSPVLTTSCLPGPGPADWLDELEPRLVVISGSAALRASRLHRWPSVPVLVLLSRRSPSDCDTGVEEFGWTPVSPPELDRIPDEGTGVTTTTLIEPVSGLQWEGGDDEW